MGSCLHGSKRNSELESEDLIAPSHSSHRGVLLWGGTRAGKSTIFNQLQSIYCDDPNPTNENAVSMIRDMCHDQMIKALGLLRCLHDEPLAIKRNRDAGELLIFGFIRQTEQNVHLNLTTDVQFRILDFYHEDVPTLTAEGKKAAQSIEQNKDKSVSALKTLWNELAILVVCDLFGTEVGDSAPYFWNKLDLIFSDDYVPTEMDILRRSIRYSEGWREIDWIHADHGQSIRVCEKGDLTERRKWIHVLRDVVVFVASLSCFDERLSWDMSVNAMDEQLSLFEVMLNSKMLRESTFILMLNKKDLFVQKLKRHSQDDTAPITKCPSFASYQGPAGSMEHCIEYIKQRFLSLDQKSRQIRTFVVNAIDKQETEQTFEQIWSELFV